VCGAERSTPSVRGTRTHESADGTKPWGHRTVGTQATTGTMTLTPTTTLTDRGGKTCQTTVANEAGAADVEF